MAYDKVLNLANRLQKMGACVVNGHTWFIHGRNLIRRASIINREWWTVEVFTFSHVVNCVDDHPNTFDERKSNDHVYGDMGTSCDHERRVIAIQSLVWQAKQETNLQLGGHSFLLVPNDSHQDNGRIVLRGKNLLYAVRIALRDGCKEGKAARR